MILLCLHHHGDSDFGNAATCHCFVFRRPSSAPCCGARAFCVRTSTADFFCAISLASSFLHMGISIYCRRMIFGYEGQTHMSCFGPQIQFGYELKSPAKYMPRGRMMNLSSIPTATQHNLSITVLPRQR